MIGSDSGHHTSVFGLRTELDMEGLGRELYDRVVRLFPICRSITGNGVRETLRQIGTEIELSVREVSSGTRVFDWTVPDEWNIRDAYIKDRHGRRVIDFAASNLHVVNYSTPVRGRMRLAELQPHLFSIPEKPDLVPYKTSYYNRTWGFCLTERQRQQLEDDEYEVCIDATLREGHLTFGELFLPGRQPDEVLISCHVCHPSLCNDNLSGVTVAVTLARLLARASLWYSYRFLFIPGTIGAITWLALNESTAMRIRHGLVLSCLGDRGHITYKRSRRGDADIDRIVAHVLAAAGAPYDIHDFSPYGYDERQYCSPGFNLPVGVLSRTPHGRFPEYHTSADNLDLVAPAPLADSLTTCLAVLEVLEANRTYTNRNPKCEPQLGKRGLYATMGGHTDARAMEEALLWVLNLADGKHSLLDTAERSGLRFDAIRAAANALLECELLDEVTPP
jgi:aminopeptidase-like protein